MTDRDELITRLRLLGEVGATQTALFQQTAAARYGLGVSDMKALSIVLREGSQTAGTLGDRLAVTSGAVTGIMDRLVRAGVARRTTDPDDARRVLLAVDEDGLARREDVYAGIGAAFDRLHAGYTTAELRFLAAHLERSIEITRAQTRALAPAATAPE